MQLVKISDLFVMPKIIDIGLYLLKLFRDVTESAFDTQYVHVVEH